MGQCKCENHKNNLQNGSPIRPGTFSEYGGIVLSFLMLAGGIIMKTLDTAFFREDSLAFLWYLLAYLPVGLPVLKEVWESILKKDFFSEFTLMAIATIGAFCIGEYPEGVAVMLFYSIGELLQNKATDKAKRNIGVLLDVRPEKTTLLKNGLPLSVHPRQVQINEIIELKAGERVPLDGTMLNKEATFNTAALTGESLPRTILAGEEILAGMIVADRRIRMQVTKRFDESALARILKLVEEASGRKAPAELFIRKFARIYTPAVTGLALLIVLIPAVYSLINPAFGFDRNEWIYRALVFLVISCPCALVISIPLGYFGGIGAASRQGILFKGGNYLDAITKINTVVFDKTGTLTEGTFRVQSCRVTPGITETELIRLIASAENNSAHPIAKAIVEYAGQSGVDLLPVNDVTEIAGHGLKTEINGNTVWVGNTRLLEKFQIPFPPELSATTETIVVCAVGNQYKGRLLLADALKKDSISAIHKLKALNIENIRILSGDKQPVVTAIAEKLGIPYAFGNLLPEEKVKHLEELKKNPSSQIAFVGDGMNDAPALALSHVGIAMGGLGSDAAIETADVVIQADQPSKVATAIEIGRYTRRIIRQNIGLAFGVKLLVLALGAGGMAALWEAVFADVGVALIAILTVLRIQNKIKG
ncbi:MAG: heavy metal translocating P-type ATPase [Candidatus Symbiothrix sp.]|jgi:Cd2+/Zn2+-exporting ATPase|nr:heavy metal translocating P-type ATPase [Candidatus Symbiothrix sp.]